MNKEESLKQLNEQIQELERKRDAIKADIANDDYQDFYLAFEHSYDDGYLYEPNVTKVRARFGGINNYTKQPHYKLDTGGFIEKKLLFKTKSEAISFLREKAAEFQREVNDKVHSKIDEFEENEDLQMKVGDKVKLIPGEIEDFIDVIDARDPDGGSVTPEELERWSQEDFRMFNLALQHQEVDGYQFEILSMPEKDSPLSLWITDCYMEIPYELEVPVKLIEII